MKRLFNFYLEDEVRDKANEKLKNLLGETTKGALASLIRVMINDFIAEEDQIKLSKLTADILENYMTCQFSSKRSKL